MKICWDNLEKLEYKHNRGDWQDKKWKVSFYIYKDSCKNCGEPFLSQKGNKGKFCNKSCSQSGNNNTNYGNHKKHSEEIKYKISQGLKDRKHSEESKIKMSISHIKLYKDPQNHPRWEGGISDNPYCSGWTQLTKELKKDDGNKCQNPLCERKSQRITSHHIDYDKEHCNPSNLITLCNSCNVKANSNRNWWQEYYIEIKRRLDG